MKTIDAITPTIEAFSDMVIKGVIKRQDALKELRISNSYLSQIINRKRPPTTKRMVIKIFAMVVCKQFVNSKQYTMK